MKQLIICSASDAHLLHNIVRRVTLYRGYNCDNSESRLELLQGMKDLERAYFVVSNPVMSSSALQAMCYSLYPRLLNADCWKITLEPAKIPLGFAFLRNLPEGRPYTLTPAESLLRRVQAAFAA